VAALRSRDGAIDERQLLDLPILIGAADPRGEGLDSVDHHSGAQGSAVVERVLSAGQLAEDDGLLGHLGQLRHELPRPLDRHHGVPVSVKDEEAVPKRGRTSAASFAGHGPRSDGPASLHLDVSLGTWAADGLLAIFFFVAGLELKREFVAGDLLSPRRAALPVAAAVGGMASRPCFTPRSTSAPKTRAARLGHPHRHRHRPCRAGRHQHTSAG
jgi:hypothetical protein